MISLDLRVNENSEHIAYFKARILDGAHQPVIGARAAERDEVPTGLEHAQRGSQVCLARADGAFAIMQALIARGVIGDYRAGDGGRHPDILRFGLTPLYTGFADVWQAVEHLRQVLASVGLADFEQAYPAALSGGMKMRASIARALVGEPALVMADEPTANLDSETAMHIVELMLLKKVPKE